MEDFRNKIKDYKATPSLTAWQQMESKLNASQSKRKKRGFIFWLNSFLITIGLVFALYSVNPLSFINQNNTLARSSSTINSEIKSSKSTKLSNPESSEENIKDVQNKPALTKRDIINKSYNKTNRDLSKSQKNIVDNTKSLTTFYKDSNTNKKNAISELEQTFANEQKIKNDESNPSEVLNTTKQRVALLPLSNINSIQYNRISDQQGTITITLPTETIEVNSPSKIRLSFGGGISNDVLDRRGINLFVEGSYLIFKRFECGIRIHYAKTGFNQLYELSPKIIDFDKEFASYLTLRYIPLKFGDLDIYLDGGVGYGNYKRNFRQNAQGSSGNLIFINNTTALNSFSYYIGAGTRFELRNNFGLGFSISTSNNELLHTQAFVSKRF